MDGGDVADDVLLRETRNVHLRLADADRFLVNLDAVLVGLAVELIRLLMCHVGHVLVGL